MPPEANDQLPKPVGETAIAPTVLEGERRELARRLDDLFSVNGRNERPSEWLRGAVFVSQDKLKANSDWVAQASHSLREILYQFYNNRVGGKGAETIREFLTNYGSAQSVEVSIANMDAMWSKLCDVAHHGKRIEDIEEGDFDTLLAAFEKVMNEALERQVDVHKEEDEVLANPPE